MRNPKDEQRAMWDAFSRTGRIGAYLTYRALLAAQSKEDHS